MRPATQSVSNSASRPGFTIVELLIVIVVIGILAAIVVVAYNGIRTRAEDAAMQNEASQAGKKVLTYKSLNSDALPADATAAGMSAGSGRDIYYRATPDGKNFCVAVSITGSPERAYSFTSTNQSAKKGTCQGYVLVPGNTALGTSDFWVMKYEAKDVNGTAYSQAASTPWVSISQTDAISRSSDACDGCHLISEAEWMTLAGNVLGVSSNWSGGTVGSGYVFSGHNDYSPNNLVPAAVADADSYSGTGNFGGEATTTNTMQGNSQRRTLSLSNGEVIWDLSGNVWEWTAGTIPGGQQPGLASDGGYVWKQWNSGSMLWGSLSLNSRPGVLATQPGLAGIGAWTSATGIGRLYSNYSSTESDRGFRRGGSWLNTSDAGVLALHLSSPPSGSWTDIGFRVAR